MSCSELSAAAGEQLAGSATVARRWLLVELRGAWERDVADGQGLPAAARERVRAWLDAAPGSRLLAIRRPGRREGPLAVFVAHTAEEGGTLRRLELETPADLAVADLDGGEELPGPLVVVCVHGRRDPCCARLGPPVYDALSRALPADAVWQSSHLGGHRFAANVLGLPAGVLLGRVEPADAADVANDLAAGRIRLHRYRGRTLHEPAAQAADAAVRSRLGLAAVTDVAVVGGGDGEVVLEAGGTRVVARVREAAGPALPASCGAEPEPSRRYEVALDGV